MEIKKAFLNTSFLGFVDCSFRSMFRSWPSYVEPHHRLLQISCRTIVPSFKYRNAVLYVYQFNNLVLLFVTITYEMIFATPCNVFAEPRTWLLRTSCVHTYIYGL